MIYKYMIYNNKNLNRKLVIIKWKSKQKPKKMLYLSGIE